MLKTFLGWFGYELVRKSTYKPNGKVIGVQVPVAMIQGFDGMVDNLRLEEYMNRDCASQVKSLTRNVVISSYCFGFQDGRQAIRSK